MIRTRPNKLKNPAGKCGNPGLTRARPCTCMMRAQGMVGLAYVRVEIRVFCRSGGSPSLSALHLWIINNDHTDKKRASLAFWTYKCKIKPNINVTVTRD